MFSPLVRAMVCAQVCALGACSEKPAAGPAKASAPQYSVERPLEGLPAPRLRGANFRRGVSLELFVAEVEDAAQRAAYADWLEQVAQLGATDLELVVQWSQLNAGAVEMAPSEGSTVGDEFLGWLMDRAAARDLRVLLTPLVEVEERAGTRALAPSDHKRWFWSYHRFALHYARIAEAHRALAFSVGADLPALDAPDEEQWRALIGDVRKAFKGQLTYGVRPGRLAVVPFWDALDCASVVGVGELLPGAQAQADQALASFGEELRSWAKAHEGKPLLLGGVAPGPRVASASTDANLPRAQLEAARALYRGLAAEPSLAGLYLSLARPAAPFRPAQLASAPAEVLRYWYTRSRGAQAAN